MSLLLDARDGRGFVDLETFGFFASHRSDDLTPAVGRAPSVAVPGAFGERATGADAVVAPRTVRVTGTLIVDTPGQFVAALRALAYHCAGGIGGSGGPTGAPVTLSFGAQGTTPAVGYTAYFDAATTFDRFDPQESAQHGTLTLVFVVLEALGRDTDTTTLPLSTTAAACPVGTARVRPLVTLTGPLSGAVTQTLTDANGTTRGSLTLTVPATTVLVGQTIEVDHAAETVTWVHGGTRDLHPEWLTSGDFFALDPAHCVSDASALVAVASEAEGDVGGTSGLVVGSAFDPVWQDRFLTDTSASYTLTSLTLAWQGTTAMPAGTGRMRATVVGGSGSLALTPPGTLIGGQFPYVVIRYQVVTGPASASIAYTTPGHGYAGPFLRDVNLTADGAWHTLVLDMRQLGAGGNDWTVSQITGLSVLLINTGVIVDLNGLAICSAAPLLSIGRKAPRVTLSTGTGTVALTRGWR